jgi:hypothetical protein
MRDWREMERSLILNLDPLVAWALGRGEYDCDAKKILAAAGLIDPDDDGYRSKTHLAWAIDDALGRAVRERLKVYAEEERASAAESADPIASAFKSLKESAERRERDGQ